MSLVELAPLDLIALPLGRLVPLTVAIRASIRGGYVAPILASVTGATRPADRLKLNLDNGVGFDKFALISRGSKAPVAQRLTRGRFIPHVTRLAVEYGCGADASVFADEHQQCHDSGGAGILRSRRDLR